MLGFSLFYVYGKDTAMHGAWECQTPWGWVVFQPPVKSFGVRQKWYIYVSRDATPSHATLHFGPGYLRAF